MYARVCMRVRIIVKTPQDTREEHTPREHGTPLGKGGEKARIYRYLRGQ